MATTDLVLNPYRLGLDHSEPSRVCALNPHAKLNVDVQRRWLLRRIHLSGYLETEILWDARSATEYVKVGGRKVSEITSFLYVPKFDFSIPTNEGNLECCVDVSIAYLFRVTGFRLSIDGSEVYSEGRFKKA